MLVRKVSVFVVDLNSLAPGRSECDSKRGISNLVLLIDIFRSSHDNALNWMPQDLTDDKSTLVQVMAWCRQATSHYLRQNWLSPLLPNDLTRPQQVNTFHGSPLALRLQSYQYNIHEMACYVAWWLLSLRNLQQAGMVWISLILIIRPNLGAPLLLIASLWFESMSLDGSSMESRLDILGMLLRGS